MNNSESINLENINLDGHIDSTTKKQEALLPPQQKTHTAFGMFSKVPQFDIDALKPQEWITRRRETLKPWNEFANFAKFKKPIAATQAVSRLFKNVDYFLSNYLFVFLFLAIYCVVTSPYLLIAFGSFACGCYILHLKNKDGNLKVFGKEMKLAQLYTLAGLCSIPLFLLAGAGAAVFWIIGASVCLIILHAVFYSRDEQDDPFLEMTVV
jgi:hypothetical protein